MMIKKSPEEMLGEIFREAGVLVGVFGVLEELLHPQIRLGWMVTVGSASMSLMALGMMIERYRRR
jgi:hypothetical protein